MQATRQDILDHLHSHGRASVKELGGVLSLTSTGVRQHLNILQRDGLIEATEERGRVGRPALVYRLTEKAENLYPKLYDQLANLLIEEVRTLVSGQGLQTLLQRVAARMAEPYIPLMEGLPIRERAYMTSQFLADRGSESDCVQDGDDLLIRQYNCPFPAVAHKNSAVCAMEVALVSRLVGADARLVTSLLRGDRACTYRLRCHDEPVPVVATN